MQLSLDRASPVPLYHQIAEALRYRIATGKLARGEALPSVRDAAELWSVNMHTVRRAYRALADEGLLAVDGARGSRVAGAVRRGAVDSSVQAFVERTVRQARERHGLGPRELSHLLANWSPAGTRAAETVHVLECSEAQCAAHSTEIERHWSVDAVPWCLDRSGEPPAGPVVATYFHYNEIRRRWPHRLPEIRFVAIHPDPALAEQVPPAARGRRRVLLCEFAAAQAEGACADLFTILPERHYRIEPLVVRRAGDALAAAGRGAVTLFTPRVWAGLTDEQRRAPGVFPVEYVIRTDELEALGEHFGWSARRSAPRTRE